MTDTPANDQQHLLERYERELIEEPDGEHYARVARAYLGMRRNLWKALEYFYKALEYNYDPQGSREGVAECHLLLRQPDPALAHYRQLEAGGYLTVRMAGNIANILVQKKEYDKALRYLEAARSACADDRLRAQIQNNIAHTRELASGALAAPDPDLPFQRHVESTIGILRGLARPPLQPFEDRGAAGCAVIVETRRHPWLEHALRNVAHFLPANWCMLVVHSGSNHLFVKDILDSWHMGAVIGTHQLEAREIGQGGYSSLLKSPQFWGLVPAGRALIFQTDAMLLRPGLEAFYAWDYVGAPWNDFHVPEGVGNGGLSLRSVAAMQEISERFGGESPAWELEDMFFAKLLHSHGNRLQPAARLAPRAVAHEFCAECPTRDMPAPVAPLGIHQAWRFFEPARLAAWFALAVDNYRRH